MRVWVECNNDTYFFNALFTKADFDDLDCHFEVFCAVGKGNVLKKQDGIKIVDRDKGQHPSLRNKPMITQANGLKILDDTNGFIIEIDPELEPWLYRTAKLNGINPEHFKLPKNIEGISKKEARNIYRISGFKNFIKEILSTPQSNFLVNMIKSILRDKC